MPTRYPGLSKQDILAREAALQRYAEWRRERPSELEPAEAIARVGTLFELLPPQARKRAIDPSGIKLMHRDLAVLRGRPR